MRKLTFEKCGISIYNGVVTIKNSDYNSFDKHYNVQVTIDEEIGVIKIKGEKCIIDCNMFGSESDNEHLYLDSAFRDYKSWFGLGPVKRVLREGWIERIERTKVSYESNNYIIKKDEKI
jgi:hypothetical protein